MDNINTLLSNLNDKDKIIRINSLNELMKLQQNGKIEKFLSTEFVNNHIHTKYSFSPYSPTAAIYNAKKAGLCTAGIMDHDSVGGCEEFIEAGKIANMAITCGFECRVKMDGTSIYGKRINNPDQNSIAYVAIHGIPHQNIKKCDEFLAPYREYRNIRNIKITNKINLLFNKHRINIDYDKDVVPLSLIFEGGSITERHIMYAISLKLCQTFGKGMNLVNFLKKELYLQLSVKVEGFLLDSSNQFYEYDLLGALKSDLIEKVYVDAFEECPKVEDYIAFAKEIGGISAYAYLGDVESSITGDKKTQKFEDEYLDELFTILKKLGFNAITYMPSRNTKQQLERVILLCKKHNFFEISGEDINSPRQSFICQALAKDEFIHLSKATYALIGHEMASTKDIEQGMFTTKTIDKYPSIKIRIEHFSKILH